MWQDNSKSLRLSRYLLWAAIAGWVLSLIFFGKLWRADKIYALIYAADFVPIFLIFRAMLKFLANITAGEIFCAQNVELLRKVSWYCLYGGSVLLLASFYQPIFIVCAGVIGFYGLLMRVVKYMLSQAQALKEENDYTI